jgi:hypothetical protein
LGSAKRSLGSVGSWPIASNRKVRFAAARINGCYQALRSTIGMTLIDPNPP